MAYVIEAKKKEEDFVDVYIFENKIKALKEYWNLINLKWNYVKYPEEYNGQM